MKTNNYTLNRLIKPEILIAREKQIHIKWFYTKVREEREKNPSLIDIGTTIRPRLKEISFLRKALSKTEKESKQRNLYFNYSSSWGLIELRRAIADYLSKTYRISLDPIKELMVTSSVSDTYEKILQSFNWSGIILPSLAPPFIISETLFYHFPIIKVPINFKNGNLNLEKLGKKLNPKKRWLLVVYHPNFPTGLVMDDNFIKNTLFPFCKKYNVFIFSETYFSAKRLDGQPFRPLLTFPEAKKFCVEVMGLHRELGTMGMRVAAILGNEEMINAIRIVSSIKIDIVPSFFQVAMTHILNYLTENKKSALGIDDIVKELKEEIIPRLKKMGWPFILPQAGVEMVVAVPPHFLRKEIKNPSLFAAFVFLKRYQVAFEPPFALTPEGKKWLVIHLRQPENLVATALDKMIQKGFYWKKVKPTKEEIDEFIKETKKMNIEFLKI